jgi:hypothetical protein
VSDGDVCDFSGLGPTMTGTAKPDVLAPGLAIAGAMSSMARPGTLGSMFTATCAGPGGVLDSRCLQADLTHGLAFGTSMAAPIVAGAIALLFEARPSLTSDAVRRALQASAHAPRRGSASDANAFPGELDIAAALALVTQEHAPCSARSERSWLAPAQPYVAATGSEGLRVRVQARCDDGSPALAALDQAVVYGVLDDGVRVEGEQVEEAVFRFASLPGRAGATLTVRAELNGAVLAPAIALPVGSGPWDARYGIALAPSCAVVTPVGLEHSPRGRRLLPLAIAVVLAVCRRARSRVRPQ